MKLIILTLKIVMAAGVLLLSCKDAPETVTDIDGNTYKTVNIGDQTWMAENLKVTRFRNGDSIPNIIDNQEWSSTTDPAYCSYGHSDSLAAIYGLLYNWYTVSDSRNIAPEGWHIPTSEEMKMLIEYLGGEAVAGGKMKTTGESHWIYPNAGATNEGGFSALPGGYRLNDSSTFHTLGSNGYFWTATESFEIYSWTPQVTYFFADKEPDMYFATYGFSVRCIKD